MKNVDKELFDLMYDVIQYHRYIKYPISNLKDSGIDSQNIMELTKDVLDSKQQLWLHKLIFAAEGMVKNENFKKLEAKRVDLVCEKYSKQNKRSEILDEILDGIS